MKKDKRIGKKYSHWFGISGKLIKVTRHKGEKELFFIETDNGKVFCAISKEFQEVK